MEGKKIFQQSNGSKVNLLYSTPSCYTYHVNRAGKTWTTKEDDFFPIAQQPYSFWAGYFTSRPSLKGYVRSTNNFLQVSFCSCARAQKRCSWLSLGFFSFNRLMIFLYNNSVASRL